MSYSEDTSEVPGTPLLPGVVDNVNISSPLRNSVEKELPEGTFPNLDLKDNVDNYDPLSEVSDSVLRRSKRSEDYVDVLRKDVVVCRCGVSSIGFSVEDRYVQFILPHWRSCRIGADRFIVDCMRWE